ncbi:MAG TPA: hypothetical protein PLZ24_16615 [Flavobacteriales bacterium]|nr:hypothetical protein [Flavobacteriales bacterium]
MSTIIGNELDRSEEATMRQLELIHMLLEGRRVSYPVASKVISLLMDEPVLNDTGMSTIKAIQNPS